MGSSSGRPSGVRVRVNHRERRRRIRRRRLVLLGAVALVAFAAGAGVRALAGSTGSPSPRSGSSGRIWRCEADALRETLRVRRVRFLSLALVHGHHCRLGRR